MIENKTEKLVYWYLRFNGYFTVENFTVHPDFKKRPETEVDILAVRFPNSREEPLHRDFERDEQIIVPATTDFIVGEVKSGKCAINENSWGKPEKRHVRYLLKWMGFLSNGEIESVATTLYEERSWRNRRFSVRFVSFGTYRNEELSRRYPILPQIVHQDIVAFIHRRLTTDCHALHRENWDPFMQEFAKLVKAGEETDSLLKWIRRKED